MTSCKKSKSKCADNEVTVTTKSRATFAENPEMEKHFLELCVREVANHGRKGASLTLDSWKRLEKEFNTKWEVNYEHKQFKNHYTYLRDDYALWTKITGLSGHGYCAETNTILWPPEKWNEIIKQHPKARKFRNNPLENIEMLKVIFESTLAKGDNAWSSASSDPPPNTDNIQVEDDITTEADVEIEEDRLPTYVEDEFFDGIAITEEHNSSVSEKNGDNVSTKFKPPPSTKRKRNSGGESVEKQIEDLVGVLKDQIDKEEAGKGSSIEDVIVALKELKNISAISQQEYIKAKVLFCEKPEMRVAFLDEESIVNKLEFLNYVLGI